MLYLKRHLFFYYSPLSTEVRDRFMHQLLRCRGTGGQAQHTRVGKDGRIELGNPPYEVRWRSGPCSDLTQSLGVRAARISQHKHNINPVRQPAHRILAIACGEADVCSRWPNQAGKASLQSRHDRSDVFRTERCLRDAGNPLGIRYHQALDVLRALYEVYASRCLSERSHHLIMAGMAD